MSSSDPEAAVPPIIPFTPSFDPAEVERMYEKLRETPMPATDIVPNSGEDYGIPTTWANDLYTHWLEIFSLPDAMQRITRFPHFTTEIEGLNIHFIHAKSPHPNSIPLLLIHGWPGTFYEFHKVIEPLTQGDSSPDTPTFDLVIPSLPGFIFSSPPPRRGWTTADTARLFNTLMHRLSYPHYTVQAGDWGHMIARALGSTHADSCLAIHSNWCPGALPSPPETAREALCQTRGEKWRSEHIAYAVHMRTRPQTLGLMLHGSPLAHLAFIGEKYHEASSPTISTSPPWYTDILTTVCLYYLTSTLRTSSLIYFSNPRHEEFASFVTQPENLIRCAFGYTSMGWDTAPNSRRAVERTGRLVWYREREGAGHFACLEDPGGMVEDVRQVCGGWWWEGGEEGDGVVGGGKYELM